ncbi:MAG: TMEM175 family protein [Planctomycetota bacterium]
MLRGSFQPDRLTGERYFRWRGGDVSRLEGLCDAVFALGLTLLVVRLQVPSSLSEVMYALERAPVYLVCFAFFVWVWYLHFQFHRRYGLEDALTVALDAAIVFVVLLFVLPLRFFAEAFYSKVFDGDAYQHDARGNVLLGADGTELLAFDGGSQTALMVFYAGGFTLIFGLYAVQTLRALRRKDLLELDAVEELITQHTLQRHLASTSVGLIAIALSLVGGRFAAMSGLVFFLMGPLHGLLGWRQGKKVEAVASRAGL